MRKLYYSPGACSLAPHILLEELGEPYELELVSIADGKTRTPEYLAINPKGRVPVLRTDEDELLTEVPAISWYLAQSRTSPSLFPDGSLDGARCLEWFNWLSGTVHAMAFGQLWRPQRFVHDEALFPPVSAKGRENVGDNFRFIETRMQDRHWAIGHAYTVVDPYLLVFYRWGNRIGLDMRRDYPAWSNHAERLLERPAVQRALQQEGVSVLERVA
jgi:glutathione S-transferase